MSEVDTAVSFLEATDRYKKLQEEIAKEYPLGSLALPKYLDERRIEAGIPPEVFRHRALYDWVNVWPLGTNSGDTFEGTSILMTQIAKEADRHTAPRGIVTGAGLIALDAMHSHGWRVGDIVTFTQATPYRIEFRRGPITFFFYPIKVGWIVESEDAVDRERRGEQWVEFDQKTGKNSMRYQPGFEPWEEVDHGR